jgi:hypothetical protein
MTVTSTNSTRLTELNDLFRRHRSGKGMRLITAGIAAMTAEEQTTIIARVATFDAFTEANDPHGDHDFGSFDHAGARIFWKIDAYADDSLTLGADDPTNPATFRVLTIMLADEY